MTNKENVTLYEKTITKEDLIRVMDQSYRAAALYEMFFALLTI